MKKNCVRIVLLLLTGMGFVQPGLAMELVPVQQKEEKPLQELLFPELWNEVARDLPGDNPALNLLARTMPLDDAIYDKIIFAFFNKTENFPLAKDCKKLFNSTFKMACSPAIYDKFRQAYFRSVAGHRLAGYTLAEQSSALYDLLATESLDFLRRLFNTQGLEDSKEAIAKCSDAALLDLRIVALREAIMSLKYARRLIEQHAYQNTPTGRVVAGALNRFSPRRCGYTLATLHGLAAAGLLYDCNKRYAIVSELKDNLPLVLAMMTGPISSLGYFFLKRIKSADYVGLLKDRALLLLKTLPTILVVSSLGATKIYSPYFTKRWDTINTVNGWLSQLSQWCRTLERIKLAAQERRSALSAKSEELPAS